MNKINEVWQTEYELQELIHRLDERITHFTRLRREAEMHLEKKRLERTDEFNMNGEEE